MSKDQRYGLAAVLFFAGVVDLVAWFCFVTQANRIETEAKT